MSLALKNPSTLKEASAPLGFSLTVLLFGVFVPLLRGDWTGFFIMLAVNVLAVMVFAPLIIACWLVWPFVYNKGYVERLLGAGFKVLEDQGDKTVEDYEKKLGRELPRFVPTET